MRWTRSFACAVVTVLFGCQAMPSTDAHRVFDTGWQLGEIDGAPVSAAQTLVLSDEGNGMVSVTGSAGCNRYTGTASLEGSNILTFEALGSTRKACADKAVMAAEAAFLQALGNTQFKIDTAGEQMVLRGEQHTLLFRPGGS